VTQISAEMNKELQTYENEMLCYLHTHHKKTLIIYFMEGQDSAVRTEVDLFSEHSDWLWGPLTLLSVGNRDLSCK